MKYDIALCRGCHGTIKITLLIIFRGFFVKCDYIKEFNKNFIVKKSHLRKNFGYNLSRMVWLSYETLPNFKFVVSASAKLYKKK